MKNLRNKSGLVKILAGVMAVVPALQSAKADPPTVSMTFDKTPPNYEPGEPISWQVNLNASSFGYQVTGMELWINTLPSVVQTPLENIDNFSDGGINWGNYIAGFLTGETVRSTSQADGVGYEVISASVFQEDAPWPLNPNDKVIRYSTMIAEDAQPGENIISLSNAKIIYINGGPTGQFIQPQNIYNGTFNVVAPTPVCIDGSGFVTGDGDGDGDVDLEDFRGFQHYNFGPGVASSCGDFDQDGDSDLVDAAEFMKNYTGSYGQRTYSDVSTTGFE